MYSLNDQFKQSHTDVGAKALKAVFRANLKEIKETREAFQQRLRDAERKQHSTTQD